ncbi:Protein of unknown function [Gryllus bimaculatus]|nr:Protein of unknown function [Gryllus bimaculatus]
MSSGTRRFSACFVTKESRSDLPPQRRKHQKARRRAYPRRRRCCHLAGPRANTPRRALLAVGRTPKRALRSAPLDPTHSLATAHDLPTPPPAIPATNVFLVQPGNWIATRVTALILEFPSVLP